VSQNPQRKQLNLLVKLNKPHYFGYRANQLLKEIPNAEDTYQTTTEEDTVENTPAPREQPLLGGVQAQPKDKRVKLGKVVKARKDLTPSPIPQRRSDDLPRERRPNKRKGKGTPRVDGGKRKRKV